MEKKDGALLWIRPGDQRLNIIVLGQLYRRLALSRGGCDVIG
jgi:hypothetical protein